MIFVDVVLVAAMLPVALATAVDCNGTAELEHGSYASSEHYITTTNGTNMYGMVPSGPGPFPLIAFMHGSTGQWEMYEDNVKLYASHGFVVLFPFIHNPKQDKNPLTTNTNGEFLLKAIDYAHVAVSNASSPLYGKVDLGNIVVAGHSMGATCSIMAGHRLPAGSVKAVVTQHPGICGPFGPPPWPSTWMPSDFQDMNAKFPVLMTTAHNDGAFWPAPHTAEHETGCFKKAFSPTTSRGAAFVEFTAAACSEDHKHDPFGDSGHDCAFKTNVETPWVLRMAKLYTQFGGSTTSRCYEMLFGSSSDSLQNSTTASAAIIHPAA